MAQISHPFGAILLAAGSSRRMGHVNKMLIRVNQETMITRISEQLLLSDIAGLWVVLGHQADQVRSVLPSSDRLHMVFNEAHVTGMASSLATGAEQLPPQLQGVIVCLGDMPYLRTDDYQQVLDLARQCYHPQLIVVPRYREQTGHPVFFADDYFAALCALPHDDRGASRIMRKHAQHVVYLDVDHDRILRDIDYLPGDVS